MNERIEQLARQAQQYAECTTPQGLEWLPAFKEKFAELIVRECGQIAYSEENDYGNKIRFMILEHFGVEE